LGIYKVRPNVGAVSHTHSPYAAAYAVANREHPMVSAPGRLMLKKVALVAFAPPDSHELAEIVTMAFSDHGVVAVGAAVYEV
jgi:ribulose-5-phosphate 4-epimerase/fuculose-1-phosphate aldolase